MSSPDFVSVHCRTCRRAVGIGPSDFRVYCDNMCAEDIPAVNEEARDALIEALWHETGMTKSAIAPYFGIARQRVEQILNSRDLKYVPPPPKPREKQEAVA